MHLIKEALGNSIEPYKSGIQFAVCIKYWKFCAAKKKKKTYKVPKMKIVEFANSIDPDEVAYYPISYKTDLDLWGSLGRVKLVL